MGTAYRHGAMAGLPTVTLANHTSILTGAMPGHHGILHNAWYDRSAGEQVITDGAQYLEDGEEVRIAEPLVSRGARS